MEDDLSRWIQETVLSSYLEEFRFLNELDGSYGLNQEYPSGAARKRKCSWGSREDSSVSAGKQIRNV